jgi:hypothetical protein
MSLICDALRALASIPQLSEVMAHGCEVRAVRADDILLSPTNRKYLSPDSSSEVFGAIHFTMEHMETIMQEDGSTVKVGPPKGHVTPSIRGAVVF